MLGADVGGDVDGFVMGLAKRFALNETGYKGGGKGIACPNGIGDANLGRGEVGVFLFGEGIAAVGAAGEDENLELIVCQNVLAEGGYVAFGIMEELAENH